MFFIKYQWATELWKKTVKCVSKLHKSINWNGSVSKPARQQFADSAINTYRLSSSCCEIAEQMLDFYSPTSFSVTSWRHTWPKSPVISWALFAPPCKSPEFRQEWRFCNFPDSRPAMIWMTTLDSDMNIHEGLFRTTEIRVRVSNWRE